MDVTIGAATLRQRAWRLVPEASAMTYYITTSIPYVNARPHLGHALELVQADTLARFARQRGDDVHFLTGTDDNALKNVQAAERAGIPVRDLVDRNAAAFAALRAPLDLSFDDFIRTSADPRHAVGVQKLWRACDRAGDIYKRYYEGRYCVGCERFYKADELVNGLCPQHRRRPELVAEENYFFRLSRYTDRLRELVESGTLRILPETRRNETLSFVRRGLEDFSISRSRARARGWGIGVPGDPEQVIYVWFDALGNYITALDYATEGEPYRRYWCENPNRVHVIGKDVARFHTVYWPAMLLSAGEPLPTTIYVHEFLTVGGEKLSKSLGNTIDPVAVAGEFGTTALRYWLLREMPRTEDGDFTETRLVERYNADLANTLGNLVHRTLSMLWHYRAGRVPTPVPEARLPGERELRQLADALLSTIAVGLDAFDFRAALTALLALATRANRFVEEVAPWNLARRERSGDRAATATLDGALYALVETLRLLALHLAPFLPDAAARLNAQLGQRPADPLPYTKSVSWGCTAPGTTVRRPEPLFPKLEPRGAPHHAAPRAPG